MKWKTGDVFGVPLSDGTFGVAQAIAPVSSFAIDFAVLGVRYMTLPTAIPVMSSSHVVAVAATWRTVVTGGHWCKLGNDAPVLPPEMCPNQNILAQGTLVGVRHSDWELLQDFMSACHGLLPWNLYPGHDFDTFLFPGVSRPSLAKSLDEATLHLFRTAQRGSQPNA